MSDHNIVATLISNPAKPGLTSALLQKAAEALQSPSRMNILHEGVAADLVFTSRDSAPAERLRAALADAEAKAQNRCDDDELGMSWCF